jgi:hypothetical protein
MRKWLNDATKSAIYDLLIELEVDARLNYKNDCTIHIVTNPLPLRGLVKKAELIGDDR